MIELFKSAQLLVGQAGDGAGTAAQPGGLAQGIMSFMPLILIFVIFYFLLIRPQQKKQQQHQQMLQNLKRGDQIITSGGIYGTIESLDDKTVQLKIANQVKIKMSRSAIAGVQTGETGVSEE
ncbi:YajC protein [Candidatus Moduliflexus flocculans]|uniref:YajC protein n=1 Tax=Candidatus Moduliflexus flocculans TaxID=1499966 RepID=A0A081BNW3_9BACT|nr:YajC protein [Candidatus Moduliflexus flocculans]